MPQTLAEWLIYIGQLHPKSIAMGLDRANQMIEHLALKPTFKVITVGGTNGKGSTSTILAQIYLEAGYRVGCYTSPHLIDYNERVTVNLKQASDNALCEAFSFIEKARQALDLELTYFEVGTLAAVWHFMQADIDVAILEVGLGGRLDTVNAFEPDCAIITSVDLDHQEFLGHTREAIAYEKSAIYRPNKPAICGDAAPPQSLLSYGQSIKASLLLINEHFTCQPVLASPDNMQFKYLDTELTLSRPNLIGHYQLSNASCAIMAVLTLARQLPVPFEAIQNAMQNVTLAGRFQTVREQPKTILDVAHNPHAASALAENLQKISQTGDVVIAVFAMLADKDIAGVIKVLSPLVHCWFIGDIHHQRGETAHNLESRVLALNPNSQTHTFNSVQHAYEAAQVLAEKYLAKGESVKIIAFGSFFTIADILRLERDRV